MARKSRLTTAEVIRNAAEIFHKVRWGFGIVVCPYCGSVHIKSYDGYKYKCNSCKNRFSDKTRTVMHGSKLPVSVWMQAIYEMFGQIPEVLEDVWVAMAQDDEQRALEAINKVQYASSRPAGARRSCRSTSWAGRAAPSSRRAAGGGP